VFFIEYWDIWLMGISGPVDGAAARERLGKDPQIRRTNFENNLRRDLQQRLDQHFPYIRGVQAEDIHTPQPPAPDMEDHQSR
jgi:hypothetical protein